MRAVAAGLLSLAAPAVAWCDIVIFDNGRFLQVDGYRVEGERVEISLPSGGRMTLPLVRIERIVDDEVVRETSPVPIPAEAAVDLGFPADAEVPEVPFGESIFQFARDTNVNPELVAAVVRAESAFDPMAVSSKGARGLMQLMPATGRELGATPQELFDPEINLRAGVTYLGRLIERYENDLPLVLAAYNAGEGAVARHRGVPPYRETREYIRRIYAFLGIEVPSPPSSGK